MITCFVEMEYPIYANAHRGKMSKVGVSPSHPPIIEDETPFVPSRGWAEMIKKVYQIDPLICPQCGDRMRIISFIEDHKVIDKIIAHLKLTFHAERPASPSDRPEGAVDGSRREGRVFLRAFLTAFCRFERRSLFYG